MVINRLAFGALAAACVLAAGGGAYLASRQAAPARPTQLAVQSAQPDVQKSSIATPAPGGTVGETEALVNEPAKTPAEAEAPKYSKPAVESAGAGKRNPASTVASSGPLAPPKASTSDGAAAKPSASSSGAIGLDKPWPSRPNASDPSSSTPPADTTSSTMRPTDPATSDPASKVAAPPSVPDPPEKTYEELIVSADSVLGLQIDTPISSERARVEDRVEARVTRDVKVGDRVAIPVGSRVLGSVTQVERGSKLKDRARLGVRFHTIVLADGTRASINTETVYREGESPTNGSAAKIGGGALVGSILGAILGGAKGAVLGGSAGAAGGTAAVMAGDRSEANLPAGSAMTVRILSPVTVTVERQ